MRILNRLMMVAVLNAIFALSVSAQCENWNGSPKMNDAENAHSIYRQALKAKDYDLAFENWQKAFEIAPAADGKRDYHYVDGAALYLEKFKNETDAAKKKEYADKATGLIDQAISCYEAGALDLASCKGVENCYEKKIGFLAGRKSYDMFYTFNSPYSKTLEAIELSLDKSGDDVEYIVFDPAVTMLVYQFQKGKMDGAAVRAFHQKLYDAVEVGIANGGDYAEYFSNAKKTMDYKFAEIENDIFDCEYFKNKLEPEYRNDPENPDVIKRVLATLHKQGCEDSDPFLMELDKKWQKYASAENARIQAEFEANNPGVAAKKLYDSGDYNGAIAKYDAAIAAESDANKKADYLFRKASIQFRKLNSYSAARNTAREAAKVRSGWGRPYMLIGDMYAKSARSCGDAWNQRLAIIAAIDKYAYAKSVDPSVASEASDRMSKYYKSLPEKQQGFMRGVKAGQSAKVGCWIGETVKVKFK